MQERWLVLESEGEDQRKLGKPVGQGTGPSFRAACRLGSSGLGGLLSALEEHSEVGPEELNTVSQDGMHLE